MPSYVADLGIFGIICLGALWLRFWLHYRRSNPDGLPNPPGPKGIPIIGNVLDMPKGNFWMEVAKWSERYDSDIIYVENLGQPLVILNSYDAAYELLERRSSIYSSRPRMPMMAELMGWDWNVAMMPYGDTFRKYRSFLHKYLQPTAVKDYIDIQTVETHRFIQNLIEKPDDFMVLVRKWAAANIMMISYGHEVADKNDPFIELVDKAAVGATEVMVPGAFLVDIFPTLKYVPSWLPGASFKRKAREWRKYARGMLHIPYQMTKKKIMSGTAAPSITSRLMESKTNKFGEIQDEEVIEACGAIVYAGGADTTVSTLLSTILAFVLNPEVQRRGQEEIDRVVGKDRLPTFDDRGSLPYVEAIMQEALRWEPVLPVGIAHSLTEDDVYKGYFIPAGSQVVANQWAMLHNESEYPGPFAFRPERFLPEEGERAPMLSNKIAFGWGRRKCPGTHLAENTVFIGIATMLATLNIGKVLDSDGVPITPPGKYKLGFLSHPERFDCSITARSQEVARLVRHANEQTRTASKQDAN